MDTIKIGGLTFARSSAAADNRVESANVFEERALNYSGLAFDTLEAELITKSLHGELKDLAGGTPVLLNRNETQYGRYYLKSIKRVGVSNYHVSAVSAMSLLSESDHMGGIYTGQTAENIIRDICGSVPVIVQSPLSSVKLYGWLPLATRRDNLSQVLFALGATVKTDLNGVLRVAGLWNGIIGTIGPERIYQDAGVDYGSKVTQVSVTEHQYLLGGEVTQLFDGATRDGDLITFPGPMYDLTATGFTIWERGANYARVSAGSGKLEGRAYIHNTRQITRDVSPGGTPNVKSVTEATLVSLVNAQSVADRLAAYYKSTETVDAAVVYDGETPGDVLLVHHPYDGKMVKACLESADITLSNTLKAQSRLLVDYIPPKPSAGNYNSMAVLTQDGDWTAPATGLIEAVLIGGGDGGNAGEPGQYGTMGSRYGEGGDGGQPGQYGAGGKIYRVMIQVTAGQRLHAVIGRGGAGGTQASPGGVAGTPTTFGNYSSASGASVPSGFYEETTGRTYATKGADGVAGGKGNGTQDGNNVVYKGQTYYPGSNAGGVSYKNFVAYGGRGGGAAAGANGNPGTEGYMDSGIATGGNGGRGATPVPGENGTVPGQGGGGGHGGGGGGGNGGASGTSGYTWPGDAGSGAPGSNGGAGVNGVLIVYYSLPVQTRGGALVDANKRIVLDAMGRLIVFGG